MDFNAGHKVKQGIVDVRDGPAGVGVDQSLQNRRDDGQQGGQCGRGQGIIESYKKQDEDDRHKNHAIAQIGDDPEKVVLEFGVGAVDQQDVLCLGDQYGEQHHRADDQTVHVR